MNSNNRILTYNQVRDIISSNNTAYVSTCGDGTPACSLMCYEPEFDCNNITIILRGKPCSREIQNMMNNENVCLVFTRRNNGRTQTVTACGIASVQEDPCACNCCTDVPVFVELCTVNGRELCRSCN